MTSPATQEPCPECNGAGGWANTARGRGVGGQMMTMCEACEGTGLAPPSQRAELLTQELASAMVKLSDVRIASEPFTDAEAAALLQHIAALQSEVTTAHARADDWHQRASQMLIDLTKAQRSVAALTQRVAAADKLASALQSGVHAYPNTAQGREMRHAHQQVIREYRALSQEPRNG